MDDIKKLIKDLTAGIKALPKALTKKRLIAAFCITALVCGACCICSLYYFEDANFFRSFYGCSTLDEQHSYYRLDDKKYIIYPYNDKTAAIDAFLNDLSGGSYEIKEGMDICYMETICLPASDLTAAKSVLFVEKPSIESYCCHRHHISLSDLNIFRF